MRTVRQHIITQFSLSPKSRLGVLSDVVGDKITRHWHHQLETKLDTRRFSASPNWFQQLSEGLGDWTGGCVKWPGDWWACLNVNHLSNDFPDLHLNWITNWRDFQFSEIRSKIETRVAKLYLIQNDWCILQCFNRHFQFNVVKLRLWAADD